jgi:iron-sulfur cluster assembly protein
MITLTPQAVAQIKQVQSLEKREFPILRVSVAGGGCSGLSYKLDFEQTIHDKDRVFEQDGVKVVCDGKSFLYLNGMELDFSGGLNGKGFTFNNPNAKKSCGCGSSFSA